MGALRVGGQPGTGSGWPGPPFVADQATSRSVGSVTTRRSQKRLCPSPSRASPSSVTGCGPLTASSTCTTSNREEEEEVGGRPVSVDGRFWHGCPQHATTARANANDWATKV